MDKKPKIYLAPMNAIYMRLKLLFLNHIGGAGFPAMK
jgi:hypothetical protein